jgi:hypothetical protein
MELPSLKLWLIESSHSYESISQQSIGNDLLVQGSLRVRLGIGASEVQMEDKLTNP